MNFLFYRYGHVEKVIIYKEKQSEEDDGDVIVKIFVEFSAMFGEFYLITMFRAKEIYVFFVVVKRKTSYSKMLTLKRLNFLHL